jgi:hypothetical protein
MNRKWLAATTALTLVVALLVAGAAYDHWIVTRHTARARLARLVLTSPPPGYGAKPASTNQVAASSSPLSTYKAFAQARPSSTGAYSVSWTKPSSTTDSATILVSLLPSAVDASKVQAQAATQFVGPDSFKAQNYALSGSIPVPGVPGAKAAVFKATGTATTPPVAAVTFATGRVQVLELLGQTGTPESTGATAAALARAEYEHLGQSLPGFSLQVTQVPPVASIVYWLVVVGTLGLVVAVPLAVRRVRARRAAARLRTARRQHQVRGSKIARRQAARRR